MACNTKQENKFLSNDSAGSLILESEFLPNHATCNISPPQFECGVCKQIFSSGDSFCHHLKINSTEHEEEGVHHSLPSIIHVHNSSPTESCSHGHMLTEKQIIYGDDGKEEKIFECQNCGENFSKIKWTVKQCENQMYLIKQDRAKKLLIKAKLFYASKRHDRVQSLYSLRKSIKQLKKNRESVKQSVNTQSENSPFISYLNTDATKKVKKCAKKNGKQNMQKEPIRTIPCPKSKKILQFQKNQKKNVKTKVKEYSCPICFAVFFDSMSYRAHIATHTHCVHCDKVFKAYENLRHHLKTHGTTQDYLCNVCGKRFKAQQNLTKHKLIHMEGSGVVCSICGKVFKAKPNLQKHMVTHNDTLSYSCDICGKRFKAIQNLQKHSKIHMKKTGLT